MCQTVGTIYSQSSYDHVIKGCEPTLFPGRPGVATNLLSIASADVGQLAQHYGSMHPIVRKLSLFTRFTQEEAGAIADLSTRVVEVPAHIEIVREDDLPDHVIFLLRGFACRHKLLPSGKQQILAFMIPGDVCDPGITLLDRRDHSISAMSSCQIGHVADDELTEIGVRFPKVGAALRWASLVEDAINREWIVNLGQRQALGRMAHVICELYYRLRAIGQVDGPSYALPVSQAELGNAMGISSVHINRTLQELRGKKLIAFSDRRMTILDLRSLETLGEFDPAYLHQEAVREAHCR